jgi:hypothetical protein
MPTHTLLTLTDERNLIVRQFEFEDIGQASTEEP